MGKHKKPRKTKLDKLWEQGHWIAGEPSFLMPTPELQKEFHDRLEAHIQKHLIAGGFELISPVQRNYPFHSALFRERIDALMHFMLENGFIKPAGFEMPFSGVQEGARLEAGISAVSRDAPRPVTGL